MDFENFERLEARITDLSEKMVSLKESHEQMARELERRERQLVELNEKVTQFDMTKEKINSKIEALLKRLETLHSDEEH